MAPAVLPSDAIPSDGGALGVPPPVMCAAAGRLQKDAAAPQGPGAPARIGHADSPGAGSAGGIPGGAFRRSECNGGRSDSDSPAIAGVYFGAKRARPLEWLETGGGLHPAHKLERNGRSNRAPP